MAKEIIAMSKKEIDRLRILHRVTDFGVGPHEVVEFSEVKQKNGLKIGVKTAVLVSKMYV